MNRALGRKQHDPLAVDSAPKLADHYATEAPPLTLGRLALSLSHRVLRALVKFANRCSSVIGRKFLPFVISFHFFTIAARQMRQLCDFDGGLMIGILSGPNA